MLKRTLATALGLLLYLAADATAQYFGPNKVQYERLHFEVIETPHFDVHYYAEEREAAHIAARLAERWYERLSKVFGHSFDRRQPIVLYASHSHFAQTSILPGAVPEGVGGFTDHQAGRVVLPFAAGMGETDHVLGHEIVHAFQRDILRKNRQSLASLPLWFTEGMAEYLSLEEVGSNTRMWLRDAVSRKRLPALDELENPRWFPYRYGQVLWMYLADAYGDHILTDALVRRPSRSGALGRIEDATGRSSRVLTRGWHEYIRGVAGELDQRPASEITVVARAGARNLAPALSPDGRHLVFLSDVNGYSLDVFLANSRSGAIERKLLSTATDPHFDSLQFIDSAGAWSPAGDRFALATVKRGRPAITLFSMPDGEMVREYAVDGIDQIYTPSWSPDGEQLAFTGLHGGFADLYVMSLPDGTIKPLTSDAYSDLQPSWSPDGTRLAFTSDRFTSSLTSLTFGRYLLGTVDVETGEVEFLGGTSRGKSIDPQWCPDGSCVYFVSDADDVNNVYRLDLESGEAARLTDVVTGVSGMTALSPSISLGAAGKRLAFAAYSAGRYEVRVIYLAPAERTATFRQGAAAPSTRVVTASQSATTGAGADLASVAFSARRYSSRLTLFSIGQPYMTAAGGPFGTNVRAGISVSATDLLGQHRVGLAVQGGRHLADVAFESSYINRSSRWNWGVAGSQVPWLVEGRDRQVHRQATGLMIYPFSRARRLETTLGVEAVAFNTTATSIITGAALVHDNAVSGVTSPLLGQRYRISLTSSAGDLNVLTAAADYRRYFTPFRGFTFATRLQHVTRLGPAASDERMLPIVTAARDVARGFRHTTSTERAWQMSSLNLEVRTPLATVLRSSRTRRLPIEVFGFSDIAGFNTQRRTALSSVDNTLWSAGGGARINAAGFVFEINAARPLSGPGPHDWGMVANFRPGF